MLDFVMGAEGTGIKDAGVLVADEPRFWEFFTYQFLHASLSHVGFNMLFLYIFGNAVNSKMGNVAYLLFYLAGGVFAGLAFAYDGQGRVLGASGSVAAVTAAYMVLYPRSRVTVFYFFFFIGVIQVPSLWLIAGKIVLWDNILAPGLQGGDTVAYSCHLGGYLFGFAVPMIMLWVRALPRDQFDLLALWGRFRRRRRMATAYGGPQGEAQARYGRVARPATPTVGASDAQSKAEDQLIEGVLELRGRISAAAAGHDAPSAARLYRDLVGLDDTQVLPESQQVEVANQLMSEGQHAAAAQAYEGALRTYPSAADRDQFHLLLGIIYSRYVADPAKAAEHLNIAQGKLVDEKQLSLCRSLLAAAALQSDGGASGEPPG